MEPNETRSPQSSPDAGVPQSADARLVEQLRRGDAEASHRFFPQVTEADLAPQESQIVPTELDLQVIYMPGSSHRRAVVIAGRGGDDWRATWAG